MLYRITGAIDTIPSTVGKALAGTITTDGSNSSVLIYSGSNDIGAIYTPGRISVNDSPMWLFVKVPFTTIAATPLLVRVIGLYHLVVSNIGANNKWAITIDRAFPSLAGATGYYLQGPAWYSAGVDGGGAANFLDGEKGSGYVAINVGETVTPKGYQLNVQRVKLYAPVYVDATGTDVVVELQV